MASKVLVTGATGTVGSEVVKALAQKGAEVLVGVRSPEKAAALRSERVTPVELDFARRATYEAALAGAEKMFLLTPFDENQVEVGRGLIDAARAAGVRHIVKMSALGSEVEPGIQLGRWHREIEKHLEASGVGWTILRPNSFMQNFITFMSASIKADGRIYMPQGEGKVSYIDVRDIAAVAAALLTGDAHAGEAFDLTGPEALSGSDVAREIARAIGKEVVYIDVPEVAFRRAMADAPAWMVDAMMELYGINKAGYAAQISDAVEKLSGRAPISFEQFARDHVSAFR